MSRRSTSSSFTRRGFLAGAAAVGGVSLAGPGFPSLARLEGTAEERLARASRDRLEKAYEVRVGAARRARGRGVPLPQPNGDEERLPDGIACYSKGLPHNQRGEVEPKAYGVLRQALRSGKPRDFEKIPLGGFVKLANPQAALAFDLMGPDDCQPKLLPPPAFAGAEQAAEMVDLYWQALLRDVPFTDYADHPLVERAVEELTRLPEFRRPRVGGRVTAQTLFRGPTAGDLVGPYVSQFLLKDLPFTPIRVEQRIRTAIPGLDFLTDYDDWLGIQNGSIGGANRFDPKPRYIRNGRDLGEYDHRDFTYQAFLGACLAALKWGALPDGGNPYKHSRTQSGFTTFGQPYLLYLVAVVTQVSLKACWFQKWLVHRRLRPEEFGGRVESHLRGTAEYPLHEDLLGSTALEESRKRIGNALLAQAYPEGCPMHPSYPGGHAVIGGACATVLKACLDESHVIREPVVAAADGLSLVPYRGPELTVGGELDKLASNIAFGRNFGGIHWRSDGVEGLRLGEEVAIQVLDELSLTGNESFQGFSLRRFDGSKITVG